MANRQRRASELTLHYGEHDEFIPVGVRRNSSKKLKRNTMGSGRFPRSRGNLAFPARAREGPREGCHRPRFGRLVWHPFPFGREDRQHFAKRSLEEHPHTSSLGIVAYRTFKRHGPQVVKGLLFNLRERQPPSIGRDRGWKLRVWALGQLVPPLLRRRRREGPTGRQAVGRPDSTRENRYSREGRSGV